MVQQTAAWYATPKTVQQAVAWRLTNGDQYNPSVMSGRIIKSNHAKHLPTFFECECYCPSNCASQSNCKVLPSPEPSYCYKDYDSLIHLQTCPVCEAPMPVGITFLKYSCIMNRLYRVCERQSCAAVFTVITHQAGLKRREELGEGDLIKDWMEYRKVDMRVVKWRDEVAAAMERESQGFWR